MRFRKTVDVAALGLFLALSLFGNFFHTETTIQERDDCPACHFQKCSLSTTAVHFTLPIVCTCTSVAISEEFAVFENDGVHRASPRGPPLA
jgi:hypothetical protein